MRIFDYIPRQERGPDLRHFQEPFLFPPSEERELPCFFACLDRTFAALFLIAKMRKRDIAEVASYATALIVIAILMMLANCLLAVFQPRYTLPMWELTLVSLSILFGGMMDALFYPSRPLHSPELNDQAKHSDQVSKES